MTPAPLSPPSFRRSLYALCLLAASLLTPGCASEDPVDTPEPECAEGRLGCSCDAAEACETNESGVPLLCVAGTCQDCAAGVEGCICKSGARCGPDLECSDNNLCQQASCTIGESGCACDAAGQCATSALHCATDGLCRGIADDCTVGELDCACAGGSCAPGLTCLEDRVCIDATGYLGGPCFEGQGCYAGNRCEKDVCVACKPGTQACACDGELGCSAGLECVAGECTATTGLAVGSPTNAACHTPCQADLNTDDDFQPCVNGLIAGCVGELVCRHGQCVAPDAERRVCTLNVQCPAHQTCLSGFCTPNCSNDSECVAGSVCHQKVCRLLCDVEDAPCPDDHTCQLVDGQTGVCTQRNVGSDAVAPAPPSGLTLSRTSLTMSSAETEGQVLITNTSQTTTTLIIEKRMHRFYDDLDELQTVPLGAASHHVATATERATCVPGTVGCGCAGPSETLCGALDNGIELVCVDTAEGSTCRPPVCDGADAQGCVCEGDTCLRYCEGADCPLWWLEVAVERDGQPIVTPTTHIHSQVSLSPGSSVTLQVTSADAAAYGWWEGQLAIINPADKTRIDIQLGYSERPDGAWAGEINYFGDFQVSRDGLASWIANGRKAQDIQGIQNAFLQAWATFRVGNIDFKTFQAILTATRTESWRSPAMSQACPDAVCYPFSNQAGYQTYTNDPDSEPVPSGSVELPFAMNIRQLDGASYVGKVDSESTLHYPGDPQVNLTFAGDANTCSSMGDVGCLLFVDSFDFTSIVGARSEAVNCAGRFESASEPWLMPGFVGNAQLDEQTGMYVTYSCRDEQAPLATSSPTDVALNRSLARANPVADGEVRRRQVQVIDGALVNTDTLFVLFEERMDSWTPGENDIVAYGYMLLNRHDRELEPVDTEGSVAAPATGNTAPPLACDSELLADVGLNSGSDPAVVARVLLDGVAGAQLAGVLSGTSDEQAHYLCVETGQFNGGPGGPNDKVPCPAGSDIAFFTVSELFIPAADLHEHSCQDDASCAGTLASYRDQGLLIQDPPYWRCQDNQLAFCSTDRYDLRNGKDFYAVQQGSKVLPRIGPAVDDAFRYRTRFQNRAGANLGFVPEICIEGSDAIPYCYDAKAIEQLEARVDCLLATFVEHGPALKTSDIQTYSDLKNYLVDNFAYDAAFDPALNITVHHSGFEKLNSELSVMLGDDAFTKALSSRFDLAGLSVAAFPGDLFEPDGIKLTGVAGAEMFQMYLAVQYYRRTLDRFFKLLPALEQSLQQGTDGQLIGQASVEAWFGRLIRASTQKARVWSEISRRYQNFNRPDLARLVIRRAYVSSYLESIVLTHLMQNIVDNVAPEDRAQIAQAIRIAQLSYRVAMSDMRTQFDAITDDMDYFGFPADFMPFPAAEAQVARDNGFEVAANRASQRIQIALAAEEQAISSTRTFDIEAASFQNELTRVENNYESQLVELCGSFEANGKVYPAIRKYAYLDDTALALGDPCGLLKTGRIHDTLGEVDQAALRILQVRQQMLNVIAEKDIEEDRIDATCETKDSWKQAIVTLNGSQRTLQREIDRAQTRISQMDRRYRAAQTIAELSKCSFLVGTTNGGDCGTSVGARIGFSIATAAIEARTTAFDKEIIDKQDEVRELQLAESLVTYDFCNAEGSSLVQIDSKARVDTILLRLKELELEALQADYGLSSVISRLQQGRNTARRVEAERGEMTQLSINVEVARNDPNVRIYKSDAVINADTTFYSALREAYKATLVLEYYTSQSYADKEKLFLIRMVNRGDYNLQNYLIALEDEFRLFEDLVGVPDLRLLRVSMRDDVLQIPFSKPTGEPYSQTERFDLFRQRLTDGQLLNEDGYVAAPFSIDVKDLSPLTRNHKVRNVEAELVGSGLGDPLARVYLRMAGTSAIRPLNGGLEYLTFPARTGVINAFINAAKPFQPLVYQTSRFAERPLLNTRWEVILNRLDEPDNEDIALEGLTDVLMYFYYSDFTAL